MPLSEHEQRLLDEMERSLYQNDADFVAPGGTGRVSYGAIVAGVLVAVAGLTVVIVGVVARQPVLGVVGFVVMLAGVLLSTRRSRAAEAEEPSAPSPRSASRRKGSFMSSLEERWERRRDERG